MLQARARLDAALAEDHPADVVELYAATRATVRRLQHELGLDERVRRQLRLLPRAACLLARASVDGLPAT
jgi:isopentenyldiphosphate isomerase